jgi:hypothetical protein
MLRLLPSPSACALLAACLLLAACTSSSDSGLPSSTPPDSIDRAVTDVVTTVDMMRESLALTIDTTATVNATTFGRVCKPVGQRAKAFATSRGWGFQQLAVKFRNPSHAPDPQAERVHEMFARNPQKTEHWTRTTLNGSEGWRYFRRIDVQRSCQACHGPKAQRPDFIKAGYPNDRAHGFEPGDLRGMYAIFVPDADGTPGDAASE